MNKHIKMTEKEELKRFHCDIIVAELKEKVQMLKEYGMSEKDIVSLLID